MAGLCTPLPTLRRRPCGRLRTARGQCGSLLLHRKGLPPSTPCRSPGALRNPSQKRSSGRERRRVAEGRNQSWSDENLGAVPKRYLLEVRGITRRCKRRPHLVSALALRRIKSGICDGNQPRRREFADESRGGAETRRDDAE